MNAAEFQTVKPGDRLRSTVNPSFVFVVDRPCKDGWFIKAPSGKEMKARTPSAWEFAK